MLLRGDAMAEKRHVVRAAAALIVTVMTLAVPVPASAVSPTTELVSKSATGVPGNFASAEPSVSADGRYVAFSSHSTNLVSGDTNQRADIFVRDLRTGTVVRASLGPGDVQTNAPSNQPRISGNGRFVGFSSFASNLVSGDTNGQPDVFVRNLRTGVTQLVSVGLDGANANGDNAAPALSATGRYIAFISGASNLVAGDTNGTADIFVRDMKVGTTTRVSVATGAGQANGFSDAPSISGDGRFVAFASAATNLVAGDTNGFIDVFVRDRVAGTTRRISLSAGGAQADGAVVQPAISSDGKYVAFVSEATNLVATDTDANADVIRRSLLTGATVQVSFRTDNLPGSFASGPAISANGNLIAFTTSSDLVPADANGNQDVYLRNVGAATNELISVDLSGGGAGVDSANAAISAQGHHVAFTSSAATLVVGDTNNTQDVFVRSR
jgi:Tol biopolymer transport system component